MAIALDNNLGSTDGNVGTSITLTTTAAAAAGSRIFVLVSFWKPAGTETITGINDGSAYSLEIRARSGTDVFEIWSRSAAGGLASSSNIVVTLSAIQTGGTLVGAVSFTGLGSVEGTAQSVSQSGTGWVSGSRTNTNPDALFLGGAGNETTVSTTSTPVNGSEIHDRWRSADQQGFATGYQIVSSSASRNISGTFTNSSTVTTGALVVYASSAPPVDDTLRGGTMGEFAQALDGRLWF